MGKINLLKKIAGYRGVKKRAGFTLIEVIVAMGIFFIVLIAFLGSYYSYYRNVQYERYKTIGENLAQLQLEDIQNLPVSVLETIVGEGTSDGLGGYPYGWQDPTQSIPDYMRNNYNDRDGSASAFNSWKIDGTFRIYRLSNVGGLNVDPIPGVEIAEESGTSPTQYTLSLYSNIIFPNYMKKIYIKDLTEDISESSKKIFKIEVTVYWTINGSENHVTVEGLKSDISVKAPE